MTVVKKKTVSRPSLSILALVSFTASFAIARIFTAVGRRAVINIGGFHIHHIYYGIILLAIGGWLGISYSEERIIRLAAVIYGAGGGLIGDEAGLLLTNFRSYWTGITYTIVVFFLVFAFTLILVARYSKTISTEIKGATKSRASLYLGVLVATVSIEFLASSNMLISTISAVTTTIGFILIIGYVAQRIRQRNKEKK